MPETGGRDAVGIDIGRAAAYSPDHWPHDRLSRHHPAKCSYPSFIPYSTFLAASNRFSIAVARPAHNEATKQLTRRRRRRGRVNVTSATLFLSSLAHDVGRLNGSRCISFVLRYHGLRIHLRLAQQLLYRPRVRDWRQDVLHRRHLGYETVSSESTGSVRQWTKDHSA